MTKEQAPSSWVPKVATVIRNAIIMRYRLLLHLYRLVIEAHASGLPVIRSHFMLPNLIFTIEMNDYAKNQFLWGSEILIAPVVTKGATSRDVFLPVGPWYNLWSLEKVDADSHDIAHVSAPLETIPLFARGSSIIAVVDEFKIMTAEKVLKSPNITLLAYLDSNGQAEGYINIDDGITDYHKEVPPYHKCLFTVKSSTLQTVPQVLTQKGFIKTVSVIKVGGVQHDVTSVTVNGKSAPFTFSNSTGVLQIKGISLSTGEAATVVFK